MKRKATKIVELVIADDSEELTIDAISLVTSPAIEQDFVFFGKENNNLTLAKVDEEKRMLVSPALIPNKQIFRYDPNTDSNYYVFFSKETVRKSSELYLEHNNHHKATYQHEERVSGVLTVESWIIEDTKKDKSTLYGFSLPVGTWMVKLRIDNDEMWNKIKDGELKGLSIEGYFINKMEKMGKQQFSNEDILQALSELIKEKTELKAEKIELGLIDDLKINVNSLSSNESILVKVANDMVKINSEMISILPKAKDRAKVGKSMIGVTEDKIDLAEKQVKKVKQAAKELGININEIKEIKEIEKLTKENKDTLKTIKRYQDTMESISKVKI